MEQTVLPQLKPVMRVTAANPKYSIYHSGNLKD